MDNNNKQFILHSNQLNNNFDKQLHKQTHYYGKIIVNNFNWNIDLINEIRSIYENEYRKHIYIPIESHLIGSTLKTTTKKFIKFIAVCNKFSILNVDMKQETLAVIITCNEKTPKQCSHKVVL